MKVPETDTGVTKKLPDYVKCMKCGGKPLENDWLIEVVPHSNALLHQSCAAGQGKFVGLNLGMEGLK